MLAKTNLLHAQFLSLIRQYMADSSQVEQAMSSASSLTTAMVLAELVHADSPTVIAALSPTNGQGVEALAITNAVHRLDVFEAQRHRLSGHRAISEEQAKAVRAMLLGATGDSRAVLIKMAQLLLQLRDHPPHHAVAKEVLTIYAPLAGQLGLSHLESALQDAAFKNLEPQAYAWTQTTIALKEKERHRYIENVSATLRQTLDTAGISATVYGRVKHAYSFYKKLLSMSGAHTLAELQQLGPQMINDIIAFRILVGTKTQCYQALDEVHTLWPPRLMRIKDYIAKPKTNGYQSLHTTVTCLDGKLVEVQIRTHAMHQHAEYGPAMHWHYKMSGDQASGTNQAVIESMARAHALYQGITNASAIFALTPMGDVIKLPTKATPLDFAYRIHTSIGNHCGGALVTSASDHYQTRHMVPLSHQLATGDVVSIVTNQHAHPTRDWLRFAHTKLSRSRIHHFIRNEESDRVKNKPLRHEPLIYSPDTDEPPHYSPNGKLAGLQGLLTTFAQCCQPAQGDAIVGLVSRTRGIVIHRQHCTNIMRLGKADRARLLETSWK